MCLKSICSADVQLLGKCPTLFTALDTDDDGKLSRREVSPETVAKLDGDGDDLISAGEMAEVLFKHSVEVDASINQHMESLNDISDLVALKRSDDMPEYLLAHLTAMWQFFDALDYNKDRLLDSDGEALIFPCV